MKAQPEIHTLRLILRPYTDKDERALQEICNDKSIADNVAFLPQPYTLEDARQFIQSHPENYRTGKSVVFAITLKENKKLIGSCGLNIRAEHRRAELGYYIASGERGNGYATEAAQGLIRYGLELRDLQKIYALVFTWNPASARVLEKAGMELEGTLRNHTQKDGEQYDQWIYGILPPGREVQL